MYTNKVMKSICSFALCFVVLILIGCPPSGTINNVSVPNVLGMTFSEAETTLINAGLTVGNVYLFITTELPAGIILEQSPSEGTLVSTDEPVDLIVSSNETSSGEGEDEGEGEGEGENEGEGLYEFSSEEMEAFNLVNDERVDQNLDRLIMDEGLRLVARAHSQDMAARDFFRHDNPDGETPFDRIHNAGITYTTAGENIAWNKGFSNPAAKAVEQWINSTTGHYENMVSENFVQTGMGVAGNDSIGYYFTQVFANLTKSMPKRPVYLYYTKPFASLKSPERAE